MAPNEHGPPESKVDDMQCLKQVSGNIQSTLVFFVNGRKVEESNPDPEMTLLSYLRSKLGLCGTKLGCGEGGCGACTVMVSSVVQDDAEPKVRHASVNACLTPVCSLHGMAVTTVEGIGSTRTKLHAVQQRMADSHGSQCGFCTPGIVMSMYTLLRNKPKPNMDDIETYFQGNLCRCTGYRPILEGFKSFTTDDDVWAQSSAASSSSCNEVGGCCGGAKNGVCCQQQQPQKNEEDQPKSLVDPSKFTPYDPSQDPIFPPELKLDHKKYSSQSLVFKSDRMIWLRPTSLLDLLHLKQKYPEAKIVVGNTELGVEIKFKKCYYPVMIQPTKVSEVTSLDSDESGLIIGSAVTLSDMENYFLKTIQKEPAYKTRIFTQIVEMLRWFAGKQIRNAAAVGGNIMTGSPISDLNQIFMAAGCSLQVAEIDDKGKANLKTIPFDSTFFTGYRRNVIRAEQILVSIKIPFTEENEYFEAFKQAKRREDDIAIVNSGFFFKICPSSKALLNARIAFGGMAPTTKMALKTMDFLKGKIWSNETFEEASKIILEEFPLPPGVPGGMVRYRQSLTVSFLFKAFLRTSINTGLLDVPENEKSAADIYHRAPIKSHQIWSIMPEDKSDLDPVGRPIKHKSADLQASGEAIYVDDIPRREDEVYMAFVLSTKAHAKIISLDAADALKEDGVFNFYCSKDIGHDPNRFHTVVHHDEILFADGEVQTVGQVIGVVLAKNQTIAQRAAAKVKVQYEDLPAIITMDEAIQQNSFHSLDGEDTIISGDPDKVFATGEVDQVVEGEVRIGGQEHFYLETNAVLAIPWNEYGEMEIFCTTQNPTETQMCVARTLGVPMNRINVRVKRLGGGFGGKETRSMPIIMAVAFAASKIGKPVRTMLDRDEDMLMTGHRNPFMAKYKIGCMNDGTIKAVSIDFYNNAGYTGDLSMSVMHRALFSADNAYKIENLKTTGHCCKTNIQSNTAFRGFGGPQAMLATETWIEEVSDALGMDPVQIREKHLNEEGQLTHFNMVLENCTIKRCWDEVKQSSNYEAQLKAADEFNARNRWKKRGVSLIPSKYGLSFTVKHLNQAGALIQVYRDGSILLTHGGCEMGQGLHIKMIQVCSKALGVPHEKIHLTETATSKVPNTTATAASVTSDMNGMAIFNACMKLNKRLAPYKEKMPQGTWEQWVNLAYFDRVSLSVTGFYKTDDVDYSFETNSGNPFSYFTYGAACSVVEIDCLTGDHTVLKTDIVMDVGESLNPAIDIGQIEGAFMQGYGLFVIEQLIHSPEGVLLTRGPGAYKIPSFGDIPCEFNVALLRGTSNPKAVYSSKGIGEPPLFLSASVFFAIRQAIKAARKDAGISHKKLHLDSPLTAERIRMACEDHLTEKVAPLPSEGSYKPWGIQV